MSSYPRTHGAIRSNMVYMTVWQAAKIYNALKGEEVGELIDVPLPHNWDQLRWADANHWDFADWVLLNNIFLKDVEL